MISKRFALNPQETRQWVSNTMAFLAPLGVLYLVFVMGQIPDPANFTWRALVPNQFVYGSGVLYVANSLDDLIRKFMAGRK